MTERYPDDADLLNRTADPATGVEYIPTGQSPYVLAFRRLVERTLRAAERANDLRPYIAGDLAVGIRPGRCRIAGQPIDFAGAEAVTVAPGATTHLYLAADGAIEQSTAGLPDAPVIPLAEITSDTLRITTLNDLRGWTMLQTCSLPDLGVTATAEEINRALTGIGPRVSADGLDHVCNDGRTDADTYHRHQQFIYDTAGVARLSLVNENWQPAANIALQMMVPWVVPGVAELRLNHANGFFEQAFNDATFNLVGVTALHHRHGGSLAASQADVLLGPVPVAGTVTDVVLSARLNTVSTDPADAVSVTVKCNDAVVTASPARLSSADGAGFRCTDRGDGEAATIVDTGAQNVLRGDLLTVSLDHAAAGTVSQPPTDLAVLVVIRAAGPC